MARAGGSSGAYVFDLGSGQELYASKADVARMPAYRREALHDGRRAARHGPEGRLTTTVLSAALPDETGVIAGNVVLRGGGESDLQHRVGDGPGEAAHPGRPATDRRARDRRRVGLRRLPRRPRVRLPAHQRGRPAQRAVLQPWPDRQVRAVLPGESGPIRRAGLREGARARGREDHRLGPRRAHPGGDDAAVGVDVARRCRRSCA